MATTVDLGEGSHDYLIIGEDLFFEPCGIDGSNGMIHLKRHETMDNAFNLVLEGDHLENFVGEGRTITLIGVDKIVNEYGKTVMPLTKGFPDINFHIDLYKEYSYETMTESIGKVFERERSEEVKNNLLQCISNTGNLSEEERKELCET